MDVYAALADGTRREIIEMLADESLSAGEIASRFPGVTRQGVSSHLKVLKDVGLVDVEAKAQRRVYSLSPEPLADIDEWLAQYRRFWIKRLDRMERRLPARKEEKDE